MNNRYQPRGTTQTPVNQGWQYENATPGDAALLQQNTTYELRSQKFVGSVSVIKNGVDGTDEAQKMLLAINVQLTAASAQAYQPSATAVFWSTGITDWKEVYRQQVALAQQRGWN